MKVFLTAFNGKLQSAVMDWPEGQAHRIKLPMTLGTLEVGARGFHNDGMNEVPSQRGIGEFEMTGKSWFIDGENVQEYVLTDFS